MQMQRKIPINNSALTHTSHSYANTPNTFYYPRTPSASCCTFSLPLTVSYQRPHLGNSGRSHRFPCFCRKIETFSLSSCKDMKSVFYSVAGRALYWATGLCYVTQEEKHGKGVRSPVSDLQRLLSHNSCNSFQAVTSAPFLLICLGMTHMI